MRHCYRVETHIPETWHMFIFSACRLYNHMPKEVKDAIDKALNEVPEDRRRAVERSVKSDESFQFLAREYHYSQSTIRRARGAFVQRLYEILRRM